MKKNTAFASALLALAAASGLPAHALQQTVSPADTVGPVTGLIVQLREAPSHEAVARKASAGAPALDTRWQRVLKDAGVAQRTPRLSPSGRSAQVLRFAQPLSGAEAARLAEQLRRDPAVQWVEPNVRERRLATPSDPLFASGSFPQWWLQAHSGSDQNSIEMRLRGVPNFQSAWDVTTGSPSVPVAVLDTGITSHPELDGRILPGFDFVSTIEYAGDGDGRDADASDPGDAVTAGDRSGSALFASCEVSPSSWHGTSIAGQIGAVTNNGVGVASIHWNARIVPVRVAGKCGAEVADIVEGMRWAGGLTACKRDNGAGACLETAPANPNPARIINVSFGGTAACSAAYQQAVDELKAAGVVVVAAAGNEHTASTRPANCRDVVAVAALNRDGFKTSYSNFAIHNPSAGRYGIATVGGDTPDGSWGDLMDDGGLTSLINLGETTPGAPAYARLYGTSFSAPLVSGTLALMLSANSSLTRDQLVAGLAASARPHVTSSFIQACSNANPGRCLCTAATCGAGILDARQAVLYAGNPAGYVAPAAAGEVIDSAEVQTAAARGLDRPANGDSTSTTPSERGDEGGGGGGGGGAMAFGWLAALAAATLALSVVRRRAGTRRPPRR